jgi:hypothetical protein
LSLLLDVFDLGHSDGPNTEGQQDGRIPHTLPKLSV